MGRLLTDHYRLGGKDQRSWLYRATPEECQGYFWFFRGFFYGSCRDQQYVYGNVTEVSGCLNGTLRQAVVFTNCVHHLSRTPAAPIQ